MQYSKLKLSLVALLPASNLSAADFSKEAEEYRTWVIGH